MKDYNYYKEEFKVKGKELINKVEELIHEGNVNRIIIKNSEGHTYLEIPVTVGVLGVVFAPVLAAVGALAGMAANFKLEIIRRKDDDNSEDVEIIEETEV